LAHGNNDFQYAEALWQDSDFKNAMVFYDKAIGSGTLSDDELAASYYSMAIYFFMNFRVKESIKLANKVLKIQPDHIGSLSLRALAQDFSGHDELALSDWAKLLSLNPKDCYVYYDRSFFFSKRGQYDKAVEDMEMYLKLNPDDTTELRTLDELKAKLNSQQQRENNVRQRDV
jgi:tetratricopeptide (TPR) repeat protein